MAIETGSDIDRRIIALEDALRAAEINLQFAEYHQVETRWADLRAARKRLLAEVARAASPKEGAE